MNNAIWLIITIALGIGLVVGGFWTIGRAQLPKWVGWLFGAIVLVVIVYALTHLIQGDYPGAI